MKKLTILLAVLLFGVVATASAQVPAKPFTIYGAAGLSMPMSPDGFKDGVKMGFHADAQLGFNTIPKGEFLINLGYHKFSADEDYQSSMFDIADGGDVSLIMAGGDFKFNLGVPAAPIKPFVFAGAGIAVLSFSDEVDTAGVSLSLDSENDFYFEIGAGLDFSQYFFRIKYVSIATEGESSAFLPISVGMKF